MPDPNRIRERLQALWEIARGPGGGADRPAYSPAEAKAMRLICDWAREAGLEPVLDRHGNLWAPPLAASDGLVSSGSHVDTVPDGGRYDGALGTVLALEAAEALRASGSGSAPAVLVCAAEEASRFGAGTIGSRLVTGALDERALADLRDADGIDALSARDAFLAELGDLPRISEVPLERLRAHVEVHVEQRHELLERGAQLGVVERIATPHRHRVVIEGRAGHAGEIAMSKRHDALAAAAELVLALEDAARAEEPQATVATVGTLRAEPGAVSVIPGRVVLGIEVRGIDAASIERVEERLRSALEALARRRGVTTDARLVRGGEPVALSRSLATIADDAAKRRGLATVRTHSGAGHDVQHLAAHVPALLLFVPLDAGESHTPQESARAGDIAAAADVLVDVLASAPTTAPARTHAQGGMT